MVVRGLPEDVVAGVGGHGRRGVFQDPASLCKSPTLGRRSGGGAPQHSEARVGRWAETQGRQGERGLREEDLGGGFQAVARPVQRS